MKNLTLSKLFLDFIRTLNVLKTLFIYFNHQIETKATFVFFIFCPSSSVLPRVPIHSGSPVSWRYIDDDRLSFDWEHDFSQKIKISQEGFPSCTLKNNFILSVLVRKLQRFLKPIWHGGRHLHISPYDFWISFFFSWIFIKTWIFLLIKFD